MHDTSKTFSILSGSTHLAIAINGGIPADESFTLALEVISAENNKFSEFVYVRGPNTNYITGADNSAKQQALRFTPNDEVVVYNNGVKIDVSLYDTSVANRILFTPALTEESNAIRVVVFKKTPAERKYLTFTKVADFCGTDSAWQNVTTVGRFSDNSDYDEHTVFVCSDITNLRLNSQFTISRDQVTDNPLPITPDKWMLLLSNEPNKSFDRDINFVVEVNNILDNQTPILYELDAVGTPALTVSSDLLSDVFPPLHVIDTCMANAGGDVVAQSHSIRKATYIN